jgi:sucrose-6-phosphate hydrolase SacC (GH32 family)
MVDLAVNPERITRVKEQYSIMYQWHPYKTTTGKSEIKYYYQVSDSTMPMRWDGIQPYLIPKKFNIRVKIWSTYHILN